MSKNEAEKPTSELSIMEQIQQLISPPPNEEEHVKTTSKKHPYYKRPGRGHNHDLCDACEEGGDLLCCDKCPSSFHLECQYRSATSESDIPAGQWLCHSCRMTLQPATGSKANSVERTASTRSGESSRPSTPSATTASNQPPDFESIPLKVRNLRKRSSSRASLSADSSEKFTTTKLSVGLQRALDPNKKPTPLDELIKAAKVLNPKQFVLPRELEIHTLFPGNDKIESMPPRCNGNNGGNSKKPNLRRCSKPYELDAQGTVPLPAKTCFYCRKSCKRAPLVACDYCPLFFHQDCLDPPMTALPTGLWMCPNHVEHFIDANLVRSISATERVRLWNKFSEPLDHEAVKMTFFRRVHMRNPPFRTKLPVERRAVIDVPPSVKYHYENRPSLLPSLRDALRYNAVKKRNNIIDENEMKAIARESVAESIAKDLKAFSEAKKKYRELKREVGFVPGLSSDESDSDESTEASEEAMDIDKDNDKIQKSDDDSKEKADDSKEQTDDLKEKTELSKEPVTETIKDDAKEEIEIETETIKPLEANKDIKVENSKTVSTKECKSIGISTDDLETITIKDESVTEISAEVSKTSSSTIKTETKIKVETKEIKTEETTDDTEDDNTIDLSTEERAQIDAELRFLDVGLIKKLALQRLQQITATHPNIVDCYQQRRAKKRLLEITTTAEENAVPPAKMPSELLSPEDVHSLAIMCTNNYASSVLEKHTESTSDFDAALSTALAVSAADTAAQEYKPKIYTELEKSNEIACRLELKYRRCKVRARAILTPLGDMLVEDSRWFTNLELDGSFFMRYRTLNIGYSGFGQATQHSGALDVDLALVGFCRRLSSKHATIFYDDFTKTYELINYSEFGTEVNGLLYSCDFTPHHAPIPSKKLKTEDTDLKERVLSILDKRRCIHRKFFVEDPNTSMAPEPKPDCKCLERPEPPKLAGAWEGSAILTHGSLIRFGCLSFVFAIPNESYNAHG